MNLTKIEWVKNPDGTQGYTWNPITGCLNHINGMCKGGGFPCYAYKLANGRLRSRYLDNPNIATPKHLEGLDLHSEDVWEYQKDPFYPRFWEERTSTLYSKSPYSHLKRRGIFVCDMSDLFGIGIPEYWTERVMWTIKQNRMHRFYLLTKQPQNLAKFSPFPPNCYVGVSATNPTMFYCAVYHLKDVQARVKYISFEPLLQGLRTDLQWEERLLHWLKTAGISWVILGSQTNPYKPPKLAWVEEIIFACVKANIPYFLKDNLGDIIPGHTKGDKLRQEMPRNLNPAIDK